MKTWQIALIAVGVVGAVVVVAKVASASPSPDVQFNNNPPTNGGLATGNVGERVASGSFDLAGRITDAIAGKVARDDAARERQRERNSNANQKGSDSGDPNYDAVADYRRKTGN